MSQIDRARRLQSLVNHPGWQDFLGMVAVMTEEAHEEITDLMLRTPDKLTGKVAIRVAAKARALKDLIESVEDELKILLPNRKAGDRSPAAQGPTEE